MSSAKLLQNEEIACLAAASEPLIPTCSEPNLSSPEYPVKKRHKNKQLSISIANALNKDAQSFVGPYLLTHSKNEPNSIRWKSLNDNVQPDPDISAMSVLSLYQKGDTLDYDMDTNQDLSDSLSPKSTTKSFMEGGDLRIASEEDLSAFPRCNCNDCCHKSPFAVNFNDGVRSVDFVLVWDASDTSKESKNATRRTTFEDNLLKEGLHLESEPFVKDGLNFIKIHAPKEVLRRYSEILKLRMPMKEPFYSNSYGSLFSMAESLKDKFPGFRRIRTGRNFVIKGLKLYFEKFKNLVLFDKDKFPEKGKHFTAIYSRDREYLFDVDAPCFFTPAIKSRIVQFILDRKEFSSSGKDVFGFGIERLINERTYVAAYPLHDGDLKTPGSMRHLLYNEWSAIKKWYKYQPLDYVKEYFGVKISLYFAWLGFYTHMLLPASIVGLGCFIYSWMTIYDNKPTEDICNANITMCPLCDHWCDYWNLKDSCVHARITYLFDNGTTVFFAIFMSFWATLFLELWKRYSAEITHRWDLTGFDIQEEHPRPQYLSRLSHVKETRINTITNTKEPKVSFWKMKVPATIFSFSVVILLVALALATVVAVVLYRMSVLVSLRVYGDHISTSYVDLFTTCTAACINLVCIVIFNWVYSHLAEWLTELELLRTQSEFDDSITLKIYLLQFVNYYASIFYIAFFKGKFIGNPKHYNKILTYRQEECGPGGCLMELCIQLAIIMVGKQAVHTILEMVFPLFFKWLNSLRSSAGIKKVESAKGKKPQWVRDFQLFEWGPRSLFPEYLEMVLQYGFVTIFVAAFPLAPFFALLNNILEMRLDARKLLTFYRRPVSQRVRDIGVWYRILDSIGKLSVVTNGFIIAFTSNFIPKLVYQISVNKNHTLDGYLDHTLAYFNTSEFDKDSRPKLAKFNHTVCRYPDYREPYWSKNKYYHNEIFWHILAARIAFVLVFENVVAFVMILVKWCIPDIPSSLRYQIRREAYITNEIIIKEEAARANQSGQTDFRHECCAASPEQWDQIIIDSMSKSDNFAEELPSNSGLLKTSTSV